MFINKLVFLKSLRFATWYTRLESKLHCKPMPYQSLCISNGQWSHKCTSSSDQKNSREDAERRRFCLPSTLATTFGRSVAR